MRDPIGGDVSLDSVPTTVTRIIGLVLAVLVFAVVLGYLISIA